MTHTARRFDVRPIVLEGPHIRLEPLSHVHAADLFAASRDADFWELMPRGPFRDVDDVLHWIDDACSAMETGAELPFAIIHLPSGRAIGSTRYLDIRPLDRALEIGWTWISPGHQRTPANTECKYLLLRHAFETLAAIRVQLKTDARNQRSQRAIERLGAVREGVLRRHRLLWTGFVRDSVYYSILDSEWPAVKQRLEGLLTRAAEGPPA